MQNNKILIIISCVDSYWVWRSLVARLNGVQEAGSSNLLTQTKGLIKNTERFALCFLLLFRESERGNFLPEVTRLRTLSFKKIKTSTCPNNRYSVAALLTNLLTQTKGLIKNTERFALCFLLLFRPDKFNV